MPESPTPSEDVARADSGGIRISVRMCSPLPAFQLHQVNRMKDELDAFNFGVVVCDECHYLKNQRAARTKVCVVRR